jgi:hypothetical protein
MIKSEWLGMELDWGTEVQGRDSHMSRAVVAATKGFAVAAR